MEENLLKLFKLADLLYEKQDKVYSQINYSADDTKRLEITIRSKDSYSIIEKCEISLMHNPIINIVNITELFEEYIGGASNE